MAAQFAGQSGAQCDAACQRNMQAYADELKLAKAPRLEAIRKLGGVVVNTLEFSANAALVAQPAQPAQPSAAGDALAEAIRRIPGVSSVQPVPVAQTNP